MHDAILIAGLELSSFIGVPETERASAQRLCVDLRLEPLADLGSLEEQIEKTIDYAVVVERVQKLSLEQPRALLETLAAEMAKILLEEFPLRAVEVELQKFILPETRFVAVQIRRERPA